MRVDMKRYIAFLRGVNISGRNKVTMAELKKGVERLGYEEVKTLKLPTPFGALNLEKSIL